MFAGNDDFHDVVWVWSVRSHVHKSVNPIKILVKKILETDCTLIMVEATAVISSLSRTEQVIHMLMEDSDL